VGKIAEKHFPKLKMFNSSGIFWDLWGIWGPWPSHNPGNCLPAASTTLAAAATACAAAVAAVAARQPLLRQGASKPCESCSIGGPGWGHQVSSSQHAERWCLGNMKIMKHDMKHVRCNSGTLKLLRIWLVMCPLEFKDIRREEYVNVVQCSKFSACWPLFQSLNNLNVQQCCIQ
jgi:hypothetical protein